MRLDRVNAMAVRAHRRHSVAPRNRLSVHTLIECLFDVGVALAAGRGNIELGDRRLGVVGRNDVVRSVAVRANRGFGRAICGGPSMHAVLVGEEGLGAHAIRLHQKLLPVAPAARKRNIRVIDRRLRIAARQHLVRAAMAVFAIRRGHFAGLACLGVQAVRVGLFRVRVALRAAHLLRRGFVRQALHVLMAIHAGQLHRGVDRMLEFLPVDKKADRLAIHLRRQSRVGVTTQAVFVLELMLCTSRTGRNQEG